MAVDLYNSFIIFTQFLVRTVMHVSKGLDIDTKRHSNQEWCVVCKHCICNDSYKLMSFQKFRRHINVINHHHIRILLHCIMFGTRKFWIKHSVRISEIIFSNREILDHIVYHCVFEVSLLWMVTHSLGFASNIGDRDLFIGKAFKFILVFFVQKSHPVISRH